MAGQLLARLRSPLLLAAIALVVLSGAAGLAVADRQAAEAPAAAPSQARQTEQAGDLVVDLNISPLAVGENSFQVSLLDSAGQPVQAEVGLRLVMADMGHGSVVATAPTEPGVYRATVLLEMGGRWLVHVVIQQPSGNPLRVPFYIKLPE